MTTKKSIIYEVNGVTVTLWQQLAASKTFWLIAAFVLTAAERWNRGEIGTADLFQICQVGVISILIRVALGRAELAMNSGNPDVTAVRARQVAAPRGMGLPPMVTGVATCLLASGCLLLLVACDGYAVG